MSEIIIKAIERLLDLKLDEKFDNKLAPIKATLNSHTTLLDSIAKDIKILKDEKTVTVKRLESLEDWGQKVGKKVEIGLEL